ncbi:MAG: hypothetical protein JWM12_4270 [Ilumatobacteraceae bacterium]|nr:hypothetical protein [Ilumatobacteraceae bacterium]
MAADLVGLCDDLLAERAELDAILAVLDETAWSAPTPSPGWSIRDQVSHLAWFDGAATQAITDPDGFRRERDAVGDITEYVEGVARAHRAMAAADARTWLADRGNDLVAAALAAPGGIRVPWYGPDMSLASAISARLMETWAHGLDVADAAGVTRAPSARLRHVAFIGAQAFANSFHANDLSVPDVPVRVELSGPDGARWAFGPDDAEQWVRGDALDFCAVVTRRRHRDDTRLTSHGDVAERWLTIAQAYAGPPGAGRSPQARPS